MQLNLQVNLCWARTREKIQLVSKLRQVYLLPLFRQRFQHNFFQAHRIIVHDGFDVKFQHVFAAVEI